MNNNELEKIANRVRVSSLDMVCWANSGHIGGSLGIADVMTLLYFDVMREQDKFVLSKGHCSPALYAVLAEKGVIPKEDLRGFRQAGSYLQGHPSRNTGIGIEVSTGSLGQGISMACGMAIGIHNSQFTIYNYGGFSQDENLIEPIGLEEKSVEGENLRGVPRVYCVMGDGEQQEGQVWEAAMFASHHKLDNLCVIVDVNGLQIEGATRDVMDIGNLGEKYRAFEWNVVSADGHDFEDLKRAFGEARECRGRPSVILARTIKGKGVSFMEGEYGWHGKAPSESEYKIARVELEKLITNSE